MTAQYWWHLLKEFQEAFDLQVQQPAFEVKIDIISEINYSLKETLSSQYIPKMLH